MGLFGDRDLQHTLAKSWEVLILVTQSKNCLCVSKIGGHVSE